MSSEQQYRPLRHLHFEDALVRKSDTYEDMGLSSFHHPEVEIKSRFMKDHRKYERERERESERERERKREREQERVRREGARESKR